MVTLLTLLSLALITVTIQSCVQMQQLAARYNKSLCQQYKKECSSLVLTCMLFVLAQSGYTVQLTLLYWTGWSYNTYLLDVSPLLFVMLTHAWNFNEYTDRCS